MVARYQNPAIGQFLSIDPWEGHLEDPQSLNKYSYSRNNPIKYYDPNGEMFDSYLFRQFIRPQIQAIASYALDTAYNNLIQPVEKVGWYAIGAGLDAVGMDVTGETIKHGTQHNPSDVIFGNGSEEVGQVKKNSYYDSYMNDVLDKNKSENSFSYSANDFRFDDGFDLELGIRKANGGISVLGNKNNNTWDLSVQINDIYNYEQWSYSDHEWWQTFPNNRGYNAMNRGALNDYSIQFNFYDSR
jgi:hypothetical protein